MLELLEQEMKRRLLLLERMEKKVRASLSEAPDGRLRISKRGKTIRWYCISDKGNGGQKYIRQKDVKIAQALAQKDYSQKLLKAIHEEMRAIQSYINHHGFVHPEDVHLSLSPARKALISPLLRSDDEYAKWWQSQKVPENPSHPEEKCFATKRGEYVRSKAEVMIADAYYELGIPYICEYPIDVGNGVTRFCDFATLDKRTRKVYYHEHFGMLDKPEYLMKNMRKLSEYRAVGIYTGKNLILTCEIDGCPLDMNLFRKNAADFFGISK